MFRITANARNRVEQIMRLFLRFFSAPFWFLFLIQLGNLFIRLCQFALSSSFSIRVLVDEKTILKRKMAWWTMYWKSMREKFHEFYVNITYGPYYTYDFKQRPQQIGFLNDFRQKYLDIITDKEKELEDWIRTRFDAIWYDQAYNKANISVAEANVAIRKQLAQDFLEKILEMLVDNLADQIWGTISIMICFIHKQMFYIDIDKINKILLADSLNEEQVV
jgi:hypothetical protein